MFKKIIFLILAGITCFSFKTRQDFGPALIQWDTHYLAKPDENSAYYALTSLIFNYSYEAGYKNKQLTIKFKFLADVNKNKSWIKKEKISNSRVSQALLEHEQGHVNINYLLMRDTEKRLINRRYNVKTYKKEIEDVARKSYIYFDEMQKMYDDETNHGSNKSAQEKWNLFIDQSLSELKSKTQ